MGNSKVCNVHGFTIVDQGLDGQGKVISQKVMGLVFSYQIEKKVVANGDWFAGANRVVAAVKGLGDWASSFEGECNAVGHVVIC